MPVKTDSSRLFPVTLLLLIAVSAFVIIRSFVLRRRLRRRFEEALHNGQLHGNLMASEFASLRPMMFGTTPKIWDVWIAPGSHGWDKMKVDNRCAVACIRLIIRHSLSQPRSSCPLFCRHRKDGHAQRVAPRSSSRCPCGPPGDRHHGLAHRNHLPIILKLQFQPTQATGSYINIDADPAAPLFQ